MVGTTDIPDWCFVETYGTNGRDRITEAPSAEDLTQFYSKSPIAHISKVCTYNRSQIYFVQCIQLLSNLMSPALQIYILMCAGKNTNNFSIRCPRSPRPNFNWTASKILILTFKSCITFYTKNRVMEKTILFKSVVCSGFKRERSTG